MLGWHPETNIRDVTVMAGLESYIATLFGFMIVTTSPGPANLAVASVSMSKGRQSGIVFALGLSFGLAFWGSAAAAGLGALLSEAGVFLRALRLVGGFYLLWLAYCAMKSVFRNENHASHRISDGRLFAQGLILNLSNPKSVMAWMAALSLGLGANSSTVEVVTATLLCVAYGFANFLGYALAFSTNRMASGYRRARRWVDGVAAGLFAIAGLGLIRSAFTR
jgi:threonine/homoserine/homoserine lactone efflux protein